MKAEIEHGRSMTHRAGQASHGPERGAKAAPPVATVRRRLPARAMVVVPGPLTTWDPDRFTMLLRGLKRRRQILYGAHFVHGAPFAAWRQAHPNERAVERALTDVHTWAARVRIVRYFRTFADAERETKATCFRAQRRGDPVASVAAAVAALCRAVEAFRRPTLDITLAVTLAVACVAEALGEQENERAMALLEDYAAGVW